MRRHSPHRLRRSADRTTTPVAVRAPLRLGRYAGLALLALLCSTTAHAQLLRGGLDGKPPPVDGEGPRPQTTTPARAAPRLTEEALSDATAPVFDDGTDVTRIERDPGRATGDREGSSRASDPGPGASSRRATSAAPAGGRPGTPTAAGGGVDPRTGLPRPATTGTIPGGRLGPEVKTRGPVDPVRPLGPAAETTAIPPLTATRPDPRDKNAAVLEEYALRADTAATPETDPFMPLGLRGAGLEWRPAVEVSSGWTTNAYGTAGSRGSMVWKVAPELTAKSDWSRHRLELDLRGAYLGYGVDHQIDRPSWSAEMKGRIEFGDETRADLRALWSRERQTASLATGGTATAAPDLETRILSLGLTREAGLIGLTLRGDLERTDYIDNIAGSGSAIENNTRWVGALRTTLGSGAVVRPFVEAQISTRRYDTIAVGGSLRDGNGAAIKTGVVADGGPMLRGELSTGWGWEAPVSGDLPTMSAWLIDGSLVWSPTRIDQIRLEAKTVFEPTTLAGSPGALHRTLGATWERALRRDLVGSLGLTWSDKQYFATPTSEGSLLLAGAITHKLNRNVQTFAKASWEHAMVTGAPSYDVGMIMAGVRLQR